VAFFLIDTVSLKTLQEVVSHVAVFLPMRVEWFLLGTSTLFGKIVVGIGFGDTYMTSKCLW
jgi:hypothetical protein